MPPVILKPGEGKQTGRFQNIFARYRVLLLIAITLLSLLVIGLVRVNAPQSPTLLFLDMSPMQSQQNPSTPQHLMRGKVASLGWIVGKDCQRGIQAYLKTAATNPDAALVGTGCVHPTNGHLDCVRLAVGEQLDLDPATAGGRRGRAGRTPPRS